ncbi:uncharacterized protein BDV17DRAFT_198339 [Aspergillus undulatus]|uniref:uncharacterized protein n=1 Tax=Aspergillus undulatus TaxID=1810928 RepID=UPI003CCDA12A
MPPHCGASNDSFTQEVNLFARTIFNRAVAASSSNPADLELSRIKTRKRFNAIVERHNQVPISDVQSGRASLVRDICDEFPEAGPPPGHLLKLERLSVLNQDHWGLDEHAKEFRCLASSLPSRHRSVAVDYFVRSLSDDVSRRILRGIFAAMECSNMPCSVDDIITIARAVEGTDMSDLVSTDMLDVLLSDMRLLYDLIAAQNTIIKAQKKQIVAQKNQLYILRGLERDSSSDIGTDAADHGSVQSEAKSDSEIKRASPCTTQ